MNALGVALPGIFNTNNASIAPKILRRRSRVVSRMLRRKYTVGTARNTLQKWTENDALSPYFYVYILKLDGGKFYAGQTRELEERLGEHKDGHVQSTAGQYPKLVWFTTVESREEATKLEADMKQTIDVNPRQIRRMIVRLRNLVRELNYE
jgi:predicted GIY-YIG superfamily endonuclease